MSSIKAPYLVLAQFINADPLEQFEFGSLFCSKDSKFVYFLVLISLFYTFGFFFSQTINLKNTFLLNSVITKQLFNFILGILKENLKMVYVFILGNILNLFLFIFFSNVLGMSPYSLTVTSSVVLTFFLSFQFFFGVTTVGIIEHRVRSLGFFLPSGVPLAVAPFLVVIELISYFARVLSLAIRLFANIMSGHSLLKILAGFVWILIFAKLGVFSIFPLIIVFLVTFLEAVIAFLQAYVFVILVTIYVNDAALLH